MTPELVFAIANPLAAVGWLFLLLAPGRAWARQVAGIALPLALALLYAIVFATHVAEGRGSFSTLQGVADLFANPWLLLAGWVHYLAFDLVVGTWEAADATERGIAWWWLAPCLVMTFLLGPIGFLLYHGVRAIRIWSSGHRVI